MQSSPSADQPNTQPGSRKTAGGSWFPTMRRELAREPERILGVRAGGWLLVGLLAALVALTTALATGSDPVHAADHTVARWGYLLTYRHHLRTGLWTAIATVGQPIILRVIVILTGIFQLCRGRRALGIWLVAVPIAENVIAPLSKHLLNRPRPHWLHPIAVQHSTSYPSGHASGAGMFAAAVTLLALTTARSPATRWGLPIAAIAVALIVSADRIFLGVHYLSDVVGGDLLGIAITVAGWIIMLAVRRRRATGRAL